MSLSLVDSQKNLDQRCITETKPNRIIKNKVQSSPWTTDDNYCFICVLYGGSYIQQRMYVLFTPHKKQKSDLIFLCVSKKFPHQKIRWNFGISHSVTLCVLKVICPVFGACWLYKEVLIKTTLQCGKFTNTRSKINCQSYHIAQNTEIKTNFLV